jgi:hypothetical protein
MKDQDLKEIVDLVFQHDALLTDMISFQIRMMEDIVALTPNKDGALKLLSHLEQMQAVCAAKKAPLIRWKKRLGIES